MIQVKKSFGSDNHSGVHPQIMDYINKVNQGHQAAYGSDSVTREAVEAFKDHFQCDLEVYFVFTGTAANTLSIRSACRPYEGVVASDIAHLHTDECGAPEYISGNKIFTFPHREGKLDPSYIEQLRINPGDVHRVSPKLVSITQASELGTVYSIEETEKIALAAHSRNMLLHMDGARLANAAVSLGCELADLTVKAGIDILSFGATKNGALCAEAVVFFRKELAQEFPYFRKQSMQLASKMRFLACQFIPYLRDRLWQINASQANSMAQYLLSKLSTIKGAVFPYLTQANEVFAILPPHVTNYMRANWNVHMWDTQTGLLRFVTSFDTNRADIDQMMADIELL